MAALEALVLDRRDATQEHVDGCAVDLACPTDHSWRSRGKYGVPDLIRFSGQVG